MAEICRGLGKWKELKRVCKAMKTDKVHDIAERNRVKQPGTCIDAMCF